jgi:hypothetical protein
MLLLLQPLLLLLMLVMLKMARRFMPWSAARAYRIKSADRPIL